MNCFKCIITLVLIIFIGACNQQMERESSKSPILKSSSSIPNKPKRFGMVTGIKPEKISYYKELHSNAWEGVLKKIKECNIENYSIYLQKIEDKYYLFSYYEYVGNNYEEDMKRIAADTITQRWWQETDPCQIPLQDAAQNQIWTTMEEVFHTD